MSDSLDPEQRKRYNAAYRKKHRKELCKAHGVFAESQVEESM